MQGVQVKVADVPQERKRYLTSCYGFAKEFLRLPVYDAVQPIEQFKVRTANDEVLYIVTRTDWQKQALDAVDAHNSRTSLRTCNGAGKTSTIIPAIVLWHMAHFPDSRVVITSGVDRQVKEQIFPALRAHEAKFRGWAFQDMRIEAPNGAVCIGFSTDSGGKFEGWHGNKEELFDIFNSKGPLLIIVDEGKSVAQEIYDAIERCTYQRLLYCSSCGPASGEFHASHTSKARYFKTLQAPAAVCPHADHEKNVLLIEQRGLNDPLVKSKVFAEFMTAVGDMVIDRAAVDALMAIPPEMRDDERKYMCDFAAGGDENVFGERNGNRIKLKACWREKDTMKACGQFILHFREAGLSPDDAWMIHGDNDGLGKVVIDRLAELGWNLTRVHNGDKPADEHYLHLGAEAWWEAGKAIEKRKFILPHDELLAAQLGDRKPKIRSDGTLGIESKEEMRKRGAGSPDRADVVVELMRPVRTLRPQSWVKEISPVQQFHEEMNREVYAGIDAGG